MGQTQVKILQSIAKFSHNRLRNLIKPDIFVIRAIGVYSKNLGQVV